MPEPVYIFWGIVGFLALAARWNHGWHHARDNHLTGRLTRASYRDGRAGAALLRERRAGTVELDMSSRS